MSNLKLVGMSKEVADSYTETLATLTFNNKIVINTLTEIAKENTRFASVVVAVIEERLRKVDSDKMLPLMYLIDSICKNHGGPYKELFQQNLVSNFAYIFLAVNEKVRGLLYKLRQTWGDRYQVFTDKKLFQLDQKIKTIDPAWPVTVPKERPHTGVPSTKIHVNPAFVGKTPPIEKVPVEEDETERMRAELLRKEQELILLKRQQIDMQIQQEKEKMQQTAKLEESSNTVGSTTKSHSDTKHSHKKVESKSEKRESRDPRSRDPRRKNKNEEKKEVKPEKKADVTPPAPPMIRDETSKASKEKKDKSPSKSDSRKSSSSHKSDSKKSSSSSSSSSKTKSSSSSKSSSSKSRSKEEKENTTVKTDKNEQANRKRLREAEVSLSPSPTRDGRISPLPPPSQSLGRIPKVGKNSSHGGTDSQSSMDTQESDKKRGNKRPGAGAGKGSPPPPEKRSKPLFVETNVVPDMRECPSPQVGWGVYKEENPDQYRTPVKEEAPFQWGMEGIEQMDMGQGGRQQHGDFRGRGNGRFNGRQGRFNRRQPNDGFNRGGNRGRGWGHQDGGRWNGRGGGQGGPLPPFGRGGSRMPGPMGHNGPMFPFAMGNMVPGMPMDLNTTDPEIIRKEIIPKLISMGEQGRRNGTINEMQFRDLMTQVMVLKESSLIREQDDRMRAQEDKENRSRGGGQERNWNNFDGGRPNLLGPPPTGPEMNGGDPQDPKHPMSLLDMPPVSRPADMPPTPTRSPHKNDLPMADPSLLEEISSDPTKCLNIDDIARNIRYYGEIATIVMEDNKICDLSFQPDTEDRRVIVDDSVVIFTRVNETDYSTFTLNGEVHKIKIGPPTREVWVDGAWYECYFNNKVAVRIGASMHTVFLEGNPPTVKIGDPRPDLCLGRVYALLDGNLMDKVPIYLDRKPQLLDIAGKPHVLQFVEGFKTLTINGHPFRSDFGGFPMVISVMGKKHYLRLTSLPQGVNLDLLEKNMSRVISPTLGRVSPSMGMGRVSPSMGRVSPIENEVSNSGVREGSSPTPGRGPSPSVPHISVSPVPHVPSSMPASVSPRTRSSSKSPREASKSPKEASKAPSPPPSNLRIPNSPPQEEVSQDSVGLRKDDPLNSLMSLFPLPSSANPPSTPGSNYNTDEGPSILPPAPPAPIPPPSLAAPPTSVGEVPPVGDVNKLLGDLLKFGLITGGSNSGGAGGIPGLTIPGISPTIPPHQEYPEAASAEPEIKPPPELKPPPVTSHTPKVRLPSVPIKWIVLASHHPSLKERQEGIIDLLYGVDDLQCKSCGVRFSKEEMPQYTSHLDWHFRVKRREKDNARRAQSRKWYFEKVDWIMSDEIEDEVEEIEEDMIAEEEVVISTVAVKEGDNGSTCPVCREEFEQIYKQGEGSEEGGWYLHNAMRHEGVLYHPECYKDLDKVSQVDSSMDTTTDNLDTTANVEKGKEDGESNGENVGNILEMVKEEDVNMEANVKVEASELDKEQTPVEKMETDPHETTEEDVKPTDDNANNLEVKEEATEEISNAVEESKADEELGSANNSLVADGAESGMNSLSAPVVAQQKVEIKMKINSSMIELERRESMMSSKSDIEESEFDADAIIVPAPSEDVLDAQKPRLKGKKCTVMPPRNLDSDLSGLCSIM